MKYPGRYFSIPRQLSCWLALILAWTCLTLPALAENTHDVDTAEAESLLGENCVATDFPQADLAERSQNRLVSRSLADNEGKVIRQIRIISGDIFDETDPAENNWLYRGFNRFHVNTRESVIRAQLLFKEGDTLRRHRVSESARILRARNYLTSAYIVPEVICDEHIDILVMSRDAWVTEPEFYFGYEGGNTRSGFGIKDGNFLGTGDNISIGYTQNELRRSISYDYRSPHLFNSHMTARLYYADKSDGSDKIVSLEQPFYSLDSPWAAGIVTEGITEINVVRDKGEDINEFRHRIFLNEVYYGRALTITDQYTRRLLIGLTHEEDRFAELDTTEQGIPVDREANYAWVAYEFIENQFSTYKNVNQIQRTEDIALGVNLYLRAGYGGTNLGNSYDVARFRGYYNTMIGVGDHHILQLQTQLDGRYYPQVNGLDSTVVQGQVAYHFFIDPNNRWYVSLDYGRGHDLAQHEELTIGGVAGLRGYPTDYQRGHERYLLTVERRYFSNIHLFNVVRMGAVAFVDAGRAWGGEGNRNNTHLSNIGVGLRFTSSKARIGNLLHIDVAMPTGERQGIKEVQWLLKGATEF